jgi:hypothetical protein
MFQASDHTARPLAAGRSSASRSNSISTHPVIDLTARQEFPLCSHAPKIASAIRATTSTNRPGPKMPEYLRIYPHGSFEYQCAEIPRQPHPDRKAAQVDTAAPDKPAKLASDATG